MRGRCTSAGMPTAAELGGAPSPLSADGVEVQECVLGFQDFAEADEVFLSGNMNKVTAVTGFEDISYQTGPITKRVRELYWDWAASS